MKRLDRIQKNSNLNTVYVADEPREIDHGHHHYIIEIGNQNKFVDILFQQGPRKEPDSIHGVLDADLIEIVRHRLQSFQQGPYATRENALAITHLEEALLWMNKRVEDRIESGKLGTTKI